MSKKCILLEFAEGLAILAKYDGFGVAAKHDQVYVSVPTQLSAEDQAALAQLGWWYADGIWGKFT